MGMHGRVEFDLGVNIQQQRQHFFECTDKKMKTDDVNISIIRDSNIDD